MCLLGTSLIHVQLAFTLLVIPASLRYLERLWGTVETIKFTVVTVVASNIIAFVVNWLEYLVFGNPVFLCVPHSFLRTVCST